ncbi:GNAT family N-acetyltransferase [Acinetobacter sp. NIPH 2699]|uniref:GNAT family N-acetyltransferase n=1 Tax=Acinetobacter sp. NIPH 2699 TaxID=2923433 RepID=UPI001F4B9C55|nr:GNAT family N-acetyltransferase [Acinetobacter sp. NIPH 2699]MCH7335175.1 GNAT family N-acetyltransferase [Acinetobacter sp. NIPH 2699]
MSLNIRKAKIDDLEQLVKLINAAYRTQSGRSWTTERDFIVGHRITSDQLLGALQQSNFELFVGEAEQDQLLACIGLTYQKDCVEIGTFAIDPSVQNLGYGRKVLDSIEEYITNNYPIVTNLIMYVLDIRTELIAYYERRGYQVTGHIESYPIGADVGQPLVPTQLIEMRKTIQNSQH